MNANAVAVALLGICAFGALGNLGTNLVITNGAFKRVDRFLDILERWESKMPDFVRGFDLAIGPGLFHIREGTGGSLYPDSLSIEAVASSSACGMLEMEKAPTSARPSARKIIKKRT